MATRLAATAETPSGRGSPRALLRLFLESVKSCVVGPGLFQAQAIAFTMFIAFFPALVFLAGLLALAGPGVEHLLEALRVSLPPGSRRAVVDSLLSVSTRPGGLLLAGGIGTLLGGTGFMMTLNTVFASIYDLEERRGFWHRQALSACMVVLTMVPWVAVNLLLVFGAAVRKWLSARVDVGFSRLIQLLWTAGYFALAVLTATLVLAALYYFLTPGRRRWEEVLPGAALSMGLWWVVTIAFGVYVRSINPYGLVYGTFAGTIGLLVWMYLTALVIVVGARFNATRLVRRLRVHA